MKTIKYKTLAGLIRQAGNQFNFNDFHAGVFYHKTRGWVKFTLPYDQRVKGYETLASAIYSNGKEKWQLLERYAGRPYGILSRLFFNGLRAEYCGGQDYRCEIRTIQRIFRENR